MIDKSRGGNDRGASLLAPYRRVSSGILHVVKSGCRWRDCPAVYGPPTTIYNRYNRWSAEGVWRRLFERSAAEGDGPTNSPSTPPR